MHDMRNGYDSGDARSANAATGAYIASELIQAADSQIYSEWSAQNTLDDGPISWGHDDALKHLANAEHAAQDSTSPEHGGKPWYGMVPWLAGKHALDEHFSALGDDPQSEAARAEAEYVTRVTYQQYQNTLSSLRKKRTGKDGLLKDPYGWNH